MTTETQSDIDATLEAVYSEISRLAVSGFVGAVTIHFGPQGPTKLEATACTGPKGSWRLPVLERVP